MKKTFLVILLLFVGMSPIFADEKDDKILKQKIAQMLMVGFNGRNLTPENPIYSDVKDLGIGGVILFNRNADKARPNLIKNIQEPKQVQKLTTDLQKIAPKPLFVAIDQEGGMISRLSPSYFVVSSFSAKDLGLKNDPKLTYNEALKTAKTLKEIGVNVNFVPCVDLEINKDSSVISKLRRAYSDDPNVVINQARQVILAHNEFGILTTLKHFPGHGSALGDTHHGFVDVTKTYNQRELLPYKTLMSEGLVKGVLVAHVFDKNLDKEMPTSMSKKAVDDLLKNKLGFEGLIFTDDIQMNAIKGNYTLEKTLLNTINAGNDVIVIGNNLSYEPDIAKNSIDIIFNLVKSGEIKEERINEAYKKIVSYKGALK